MGHLVGRLLLMLLLSMTPGIAMAQPVLQMADLPTATTVVGTVYRLMPLVEHADRSRSQQAAMLERLFAPAGGRAIPNHRHTAAFAIGGFEIVAEAMRERTLIAAGDIGRGTRALDRLSAVGLQAGWPLGADDNLSIGIAANINKRAEPAILANRKHIDGDGIVADCTWAHGAHLQMSVAWRADRNSSPGGLGRAVEIAQGAALREQGFRFTLSYRVAGGYASRNTAFGIAARDARITADDLAVIGSANRQDLQTALFLRTTF